MVTLQARKISVVEAKKKSRKTWNTLTEPISTITCPAVPKLWILCFQVFCMSWYRRQPTERANKKVQGSIGSMETLPVASTFLHLKTWLKKRGLLFRSDNSTKTCQNAAYHSEVVYTWSQVSIVERWGESDTEKLSYPCSRLIEARKGITASKRCICVWNMLI